MAPAQVAQVLQELRSHPDRIPLYALLPSCSIRTSPGDQPQQLLLPDGLLEQLPRGLRATLALIRSYEASGRALDFASDAMLKTTCECLMNASVAVEVGGVRAEGRAGAPAVLSSQQLWRAWQAQGVASDLRDASSLGCCDAARCLGTMGRQLGSQAVARQHLDCLLDHGHMRVLVSRTLQLKELADMLDRPGQLDLAGKAHIIMSSSINLQSIVVAGGWRREELLASEEGRQLRRLAAHVGDGRLEQQGSAGGWEPDASMCAGSFRRVLALAAQLASGGPDWRLQELQHGSDERLTEQQAADSLERVLQLAAVLQRKRNDKAYGRECACCGRVGVQVDAGLKRCSACQSVFYCSPGCQARDWVRHKPECKALRAKQGGGGSK